MRVTLHTDYAFRMLMLLAAEPDMLHTIEQIAQRHGISRNHLMKVAQTLIQAGFVEGVRGRSGGLRLAKSVEKIRLGAIMRVTEDHFELVECFNRADNRCVIAAACSLKSPLEEAMSAFLDVLDQYTLADLVSNPVKRRQMTQFLNRQANL